MSLVESKKWYRKSLELDEKRGNGHYAAFTYRQLGILAGLHGYFEESGKWLIKSILSFAKCNAPELVQQTANNFRITYDQSVPETQAKLKEMPSDKSPG